MKSIKDYLIDDMDIKDSFDLHFYSEFVLRESLKCTLNTINESYGSYIGQKQLIIDISKDIYKSNNKSFIYSKNDLSKYENIFFNELRVLISNKGSKFANNLSNFNKNTKVFDKVVIYIDTSDIYDFNDICSVLMHEMLHAYNEYMNILKGAKTTIKDLTDYNTPYYKTNLTNQELTPSNICKRILHDIRKFEQNAYLSELSVVLDSVKFNISDFNSTIEAYKTAKQIFINSFVWRQYTSLLNALIMIKNDKSMQTEFINTYNEINNTNINFNAIYKKLSNMLLEIISRMETIIPKLFYKHYEKQLHENLIEYNAGSCWHGIGNRKIFIEKFNLK